MSSSVIVDGIALVLFFGGLVGYGVVHDRRHPGERRRNYFDEGSWGPM